MIKSIFEIRITVTRKEKKVELVALAVTSNTPIHRDNVTDALNQYSPELADC
jgi:hypothetical protein